MQRNSAIWLFLPQAEMLSGLSETEILKDSFLANQVEAMYVNRNICVRNKSAGYINVLRSKQKWVPSPSGKI